MGSFTRHLKLNLLTYRWLWIRVISYSCDTASIIIAWILANLFVNKTFDLSQLNDAINQLPLVIFCQLVVLFFYRLDRIIIQFFSLHDVLKLLQASTVAVAITTLLTHLLVQIQNLSLFVSILNLLFLFSLLSGSRLIYLLLRDGYRNKKGELRTLIIGAGRAGEILARELLKSGQKTYNPIGFLDDDRDKQGKEIMGIRVYGRTKLLEMIVKRLDIDMVLITKQDLKPSNIKRITEKCREIGVQYRILPSTEEIISGQAILSAIREVTIEDILGRDQIDINCSRVNDFIKESIILVTGAGGSIGSELCRQIAKRNPKKLIILDISEYALYNIEMELKNYQNLNLVSYLGDVKDKERLEQVLSIEKPQVIFHAAAYKHVPIVEMNPREGVLTNIFGTKTLAEVAISLQIPKFILISSDKAVNPTNVMGATKRVAELICLSLNEITEHTSFIITRFGNVLESSGSVVPLFKKQVANGGPITVTHPDIERFFMTNTEACQLVLQAASIGSGGEIFVLDMGEPIKIIDLAEQIIKLAGLVPYKDIDIKFTGLRPGEKLYEELFYEDENPAKTSYDKLLLAKGKVLDWIWLQAQLKRLKSAKDPMEIKSALRSIVAEYQYKTHTKDIKTEYTKVTEYVR